MNESVSSRTRAARRRLAVAAVLAVGALWPAQAEAQLPARFYWKSLTGGNAVPLVFNSMTGNSNPFDPADVVSPGAQIDATLTLAGYGHTFDLGGRSAMLAGLLQMGRLSSDVRVAGQSVSESATGFGDPMIEFDVNVIGPAAQKNLVDAMRYEPKFSVDLLADLVLPLGEYDNTRSLNLSQNRWYGRIGAPIVWQLGSWVPGRRTTVEFLPSLWLFGTNDDLAGKELKTDPKFQLDGHVTRDLHERLWASVDGAWYTGGTSTVDGIEGEKLDYLAFGLTVGYHINDHLGLTVGYKSTVNDSAPGDLRMDGFVVSLVSGWHPLIEGANRLKGDK